MEASTRPTKSHPKKERRRVARGVRVRNLGRGMSDTFALSGLSHVRPKASVVAENPAVVRRRFFLFIFPFFHIFFTESRGTRDSREVRVRTIRVVRRGRVHLKKSNEFPPCGERSQRTLVSRKDASWGPRRGRVPTTQRAFSPPKSRGRGRRCGWFRARASRCSRLPRAQTTARAFAFRSRTRTSLESRRFFPPPDLDFLKVPTHECTGHVAFRNTLDRVRSRPALTHLSKTNSDSLGLSQRSISPLLGHRPYLPPTTVSIRVSFSPQNEGPFQNSHDRELRRLKRSVAFQNTKDRLHPTPSQPLSNTNRIR